jgi:hypothetical protein
MILDVNRLITESLQDFKSDKVITEAEKTDLQKLQDQAGRGFPNPSTTNDAGPLGASKTEETGVGKAAESTAEPTPAAKAVKKVAKKVMPKKPAAENYAGGPHRPEGETQAGGSHENETHTPLTPGFLKVKKPEEEHNFWPAKVRTEDTPLYDKAMKHISKPDPNPAAESAAREKELQNKLTHTQRELETSQNWRKSSDDPLKGTGTSTTEEKAKQLTDLQKKGQEEMSPGEHAKKAIQGAKTSLLGKDDPEALKHGVQTHLGRAGEGIWNKLTGQPRYDEGIMTNLKRAGQRATHWATEEHPMLAASGAGAIAAGLGGMMLAKKLRKANQAETQKA